MSLPKRHFLPHSPWWNSVNFTLLLFLCHSVKIRSYGMRGQKLFSIYECFSASRYIKGGGKSIFRHNWIFRHIHWQSSGIIVRIILSIQKFSLKKKLTNLLLVTAVCQFTAKTTNSEKSIYFLSLTSCSIRKLKFHMLFTCKNFVFFDFTWNKIFAPRNVLPTFMICNLVLEKKVLHLKFN